jgi:hypothetical protein
MVDPFPPEEDFTLIGSIQCGKQMQKRALSGPTLADNGNEFPGEYS